ncbi:MAG: hypothetical protein KTR25_09295 [Myxococcales bacterium]|nr:hypothetical protein [Myxococcales bacterium]
MLLVTLFLYEDEESLHLLEFLPEGERYDVVATAKKLVQLNAKQRVLAMAQEARRQAHYVGGVTMESIDPSWLLAEMVCEDPVVIGIILAQLPERVREGVVKQLPNKIVRQLPSRELLARVSPEIALVIGRCFEYKFAPMGRSVGRPREFGFANLSLLKNEEFMRLIRWLGFEQYASIFAVIGKRELAEFIAYIPPSFAEELIGAYRRVVDKEKMDPFEARRCLQQLLWSTTGRDEFSEMFFQKAGLFLLARACQTETLRFVQQLAQRLNRTCGRRLISYVQRMEAVSQVGLEQVRRVQDQVVRGVSELARRSEVGFEYKECSFRYWY